VLLNETGILDLLSVSEHDVYPSIINLSIDLFRSPSK